MLNTLTVVAAAWLSSASHPELTSTATATKAVDATPPLRFTGLKPSVLVPDLCVYRYRVSTRSDECQAYCNQAFGYYYSYVWIEAARSFETALQHDPDCAIAWLGLHRSLEKWGRGTRALSTAPHLALGGVLLTNHLPTALTQAPRDYALTRAKELSSKASHREQLLIQSRLQEKGQWPNVKPEDRKKSAVATLDDLLALYPEDEEAWFARAQLADGTNGSVPFFKALLMINPLHPGANHELVHHYENIQRPALGWQNAEQYMASSPTIPHAFHMQAHLAMRIGKWQNTTDWSSRAYRMQKEYHKTQGVKPSEDHQFNHHMETLTRSLVHDGRFAECRDVKKEASSYNYKFTHEWFMMAIAQQDWELATTVLKGLRKSDKATAAYYNAIIALEQHQPERARIELDTYKQAMTSKKSNDDKANLRLWELQGRLECMTGNGAQGVKLFHRIISKTKDNFAAHAWGGGAYFMEAWGLAALDAGLAGEAEEAFQEALAHDAGSVRGALGLWAMCERLGRTEEAARYMKLAKRCWAKADDVDFDRLRDSISQRAEQIATTITTQRGQ